MCWRRLLTLRRRACRCSSTRPAPGPYLHVDDLNNVFIVLTTFVGFTTSVFSASYIGHELETGRLTPTFLRFYHAMYQVLMFAMNLALVANNIGVMWVAIELATLTTVLMVGIYRTHEALEAAWKYFILGSVGIALALVRHHPRLHGGAAGDRRRRSMPWCGPSLVARAAEFDPALLNLAFVFLLLGYGTKVGLAPLHAWLPDAHAEGPTPISAVLSGLLLNVALYALLRFKMLLAVNPAALAPGPLMVTMGLISLVFAAFMLYRRRDIKRMFAYSSIEHMGIITFAFGMGGPLANFAGLLHMTMHSLTKSAIFFAVGHIAQVKGTQKIADMGGLTADPSRARLGSGARRRRHRRPAAARHLHERVPGGELDLRARAAARHHAGRSACWSAFGALFLRLNAVAFGEPRGPSAQARGLLRADVRASRARVHGRRLSAAAAGRLVPERRRAARDRRHGRHSIDMIARPRGRGPPAVAARRSSSEDGWRAAIGELAAGRLALLGLWGETGAVHMALLDETHRRHRRRQPRVPGRQLSLGRRAPSAGDPARTRDPRPLWS